MIHNDDLIAELRIMKNTLSFSLISRWVFAPMLVVSLVVWSVSPAYSGNSQNADANHATPKQAVNGVPAKAASDSNVDVQEIKDRIKELEAKERQSYTMVLEGQYKKIDWWLNFLAIILGLLALLVPVAGIAIPYFMVRRDKEVIEQDKAQIKQWKTEIENLKVAATSDANKIHEFANVVEAKKTMMPFTSGASTAEEIDEAVATVGKDKESDYMLRLRADATAASQAKDAAKAYALWNALIALAPNDASTQFNAGYWAQDLGGRAQGAEKQQWLKLAGKHYTQALVIKPDMSDAANNWGNVLAAEASAVSAQDLARARALWKQAGEMYQRALVNKPNMHDAAYNWGNALADEASAVSTHDLASARALWKQAGEKFQKALAIKPDMRDAAYNWGNVLVAEANAIFAQDIASARTLWKWAGEKYQQALNIKPDMYEAAGNWGTALVVEAGAFVASDANEARMLLDKAEQQLLVSAKAAPGEVAYNLACIYGLRGDVQQCLHWLKISQTHNKLPDCEHLRTDKDLDAVRNSPEFIAWLAMVCGDPASQDSSKDKPT